MRKPFTIIGAILLLLVAAAHLYRAYAGISIGVGPETVPIMVSYVAAGIFAVVGLLTLMELRK